jgi:hypothetical protein
MTTIYLANDGTKFSSRKECLEYEALLDKVREMARTKHYRDMSEDSFVEVLIELRNEGKIKIL